MSSSVASSLMPSASGIPVVSNPALADRRLKAKLPVIGRCPRLMHAQRLTFSEINHASNRHTEVRP